jgi:hypothetical protein
VPCRFDSHPAAAPGRFESRRAARFTARSCGRSRGRATRFATDKRRADAGGAGAGRRQADRLHSLSQSSVLASGGAGEEPHRIAGGPQIRLAGEAREEADGDGDGDGDGGAPLPSRSGSSGALLGLLLLARRPCGGVRWFHARAHGATAAQMGDGIDTLLEVSRFCDGIPCLSVSKTRFCKWGSRVSLETI